MCGGMSLFFGVGGIVVMVSVGVGGIVVMVSVGVGGIVVMVSVGLRAKVQQVKRVWCWGLCWRSYHGYE
jgi:hypothetical protein